MRARPDRSERLQHFRQTHQNSCQPACIAMALARRGAVAEETEARLHHGALPHGHPINAHLEEVPGAVLMSGQAWLREVQDEYRAALAADAWLMLSVFGPLWVARLPPSVTSLLGALAPPGDQATPIHSILLVAFERSDFVALDPWHDGTLQPFTMTDDELAQFATGVGAMRIPSRGAA